MNLKFSSPFLFSGLIVLVALSACNQNGKKTADAKDSVAHVAMTIEPLGQEDEFPNAKLTVGSVKAEKVGADSVKSTYAFNVANYELSKQTTDSHSGECANSDKGQHIHFIMDNKPYQALYKPENTITLPINSE